MSKKTPKIAHLQLARSAAVMKAAWIAAMGAFTGIALLALAMEWV